MKSGKDYNINYIFQFYNKNEVFKIFKETRHLQLASNDLHLTQR